MLGTQDGTGQGSHWKPEYNDTNSHKLSNTNIHERKDTIQGLVSPVGLVWRQAAFCGNAVNGVHRTNLRCVAVIVRMPHNGHLV